MVRSISILVNKKTISAQLLCEYLESLRIDYEMLDGLDKQQTIDVKLSDIVDLLDMSEALIDRIEEYNHLVNLLYAVWVITVQWFVLWRWSSNKWCY